MRGILGSICIFGLMAGVAVAEPDAWPGFRGANGSGVSDLARPPIRFGPATNVLWKSDAPAGPSSPCVWGDRIFLTAYSDGKLRTLCYDRVSGKELWNRIAPVERLEEFHATEGSPAASTPVTDGQRVVVYFGSSGVFCYDFQGQELWQHRLATAETEGSFGTGCSPALAGNRVLINRDQRNNPGLLALNLATGKVAWETPRPDAFTSYSTPVVWDHAGRKEVIMPGAANIRAYALDNGTERWLVTGTVTFACASPFVGEGLLYFGGWAPGKADMPTWESFAERNDKDGDGRILLEEMDERSRSFLKVFDPDRDGVVTKQDFDGFLERMTRGRNVLVAIRPGGQGDITASHVAWTAERGLPYVPTPLYYRGRIYYVKDGGLLTCLDARTGTPVFVQERLAAQGSYYASPVAADGRIYAVSGNGQFSVLKAGADQPEVLHQADFSERIMATPALVGDQLIVRTASKLYALAETRVKP